MTNKATLKIEEYKKQIKRLEAFEFILTRAYDDLKQMGHLRKIADGHYEETEDGRKWICAVYEEDENGNVVYDEPTESDYNYEDYIARKNALAEIEKIISK